METKKKLLMYFKTTGDKKVFTTKGDNNVSADSEKVQESQVKGIVKMVIPYIGYPSVYFSQYVLNYA